VFGCFEFRLALRRNCTQCDAFSFFIDTGHPCGYDITDLDRFVKVFHIRIRDPADVNQATAVGCEFGEHTERHYADHHADDHVALFQAFA
jgi:hypothetical protein